MTVLAPILALVIVLLVVANGITLRTFAIYRQTRNSQADEALAIAKRWEGVAHQWEDAFKSMERAYNGMMDANTTLRNSHARLEETIREYLNK